MKQTLRNIAAAGALAVGLVMSGVAFAHAGDQEAKLGASTDKQSRTQAALRDLWVGHIFWVRNVALETMAGNSDAAKAAEAQVVANAKQIAASIEPFYAKAGSEQLMNLLVEHYGAVKAHIGATSAGDKDKQAAAAKSLTDNAAKIADFLSGANANLPRATVLSLFLGHSAHHLMQNQQLHDKQ